MDKDDENKISVKSVKLPVFTGKHVEFHTWWFHFQAFATVWKFTAAIGKVPEMDLPASESTSLSTTAEVGDRQKAEKKQNAIAFANLTTALDSTSLIGTLMQAQTTIGHLV